MFPRQVSLSCGPRLAIMYEHTVKEDDTITKVLPAIVIATGEPYERGTSEVESTEPFSVE